jgi:hypothetical protein
VQITAWQGANIWSGHFPPAPSRSPSHRSRRLEFFIGPTLHQQERFADWFTDSSSSRVAGGWSLQCLLSMHCGQDLLVLRISGFDPTRTPSVHCSMPGNCWPLRGGVKSSSNIDGSRRFISGILMLFSRRTRCTAKCDPIYSPALKDCTASVGGPYAARRISLIFGQGSGSKFAYRSMSPWVIHCSTAAANDGRCLMRSYHAATPGRLSHIRASLSW